MRTPLRRLRRHLPGPTAGKDRMAQDRGAPAPEILLWTTQAPHGGSCRGASDPPCACLVAFSGPVTLRLRPLVSGIRRVPGPRQSAKACSHGHQGDAGGHLGGGHAEGQNRCEEGRPQQRGVHRGLRHRVILGEFAIRSAPSRPECDSSDGFCFGESAQWTRDAVPAESSLAVGHDDVFGRQLRSHDQPRCGA